MPFELEWEPKGVVRKYTGHLTVPEFLRSVEEVHSDWRFDSLLYSLNDFSGVEKVDVDREAVETAAAHSIGATRSNRKLVLAIVATNPDVLALAKLFSSPPLSSFPAEFFGSVSDARAWLKARFG